MKVSFGIPATFDQQVWFLYREDNGSKSYHPFSPTFYAGEWIIGTGRISQLWTVHNRVCTNVNTVTIAAPEGKTYPTGPGERSSHVMMPPEFVYRSREKAEEAQKKGIPNCPGDLLEGAHLRKGRICGGK